MKPLKAVIIDDEVWTRQVIRSLGDWERFGIEIAGEASDGEYGRELIRQVRPQLVITDVCMPHMDGLELVEELRKEKSPVQVIFISGYDDYAYIRKAMKLEAADYLLKPVKAEELNNQLKLCREKLDRITVEGTDLFSAENFSAGFLNELLAGEFSRIWEELSESLNSEEESVMESKFLRLEQLFSGERENIPDKSDMIGIYYSLTQLLQQFISKRGYGMKDIFEDDPTIFVFSCDSSYQEMIGFCKNLYVTAMERIRILFKSRNRLDINRVKKYLEEHYKEGITLEQTAGVFFVSREYLSKVFKAETGKGFTEYVTALRMEKVKKLLVEERIPIKDAAVMVGYLDQAHFYKTFKKYFGITPGEMKPV